LLKKLEAIRAAIALGSLHSGAHDVSVDVKVLERVGVENSPPG
jgi:hypothetical protein